MSRPLVVCAALAFAIAGLLPVGVMALRLAPADLAGVLDARTGRLFLATLSYGLRAAALALLFGLPFGWLTARCALPTRGLLRPLGLLPLVLPPLFLAVAWNGMTGAWGEPVAVWVSGAATFPLVAVFTARAVERVDGRLVDAARLGGGLRAVARLDLRLALPSALVGACLAFVFTVNDFSVPDFVSWIAAEKFSVYADTVFASWKLDASPGRAVATSLPLVALTMASLLPALALRRRGSLASMVGDFRSAAPLPLGRARIPALLFSWALVGAAGLAPVGRLVWEAGGGAAPTKAGTPVRDAAAASRGWSLEHLREAFARALELARDDLVNSILCAAAAATLVVPVALVLGHALERARRGRWFEPLALLPLAVPAVLFGIGYIATWNHDWSASFYDGPGLVVLLFSGRFAVFALLGVAAAVAMLDPNLEDAARLAGAGPIRRLTRIVAPSQLPALIGGWVLVFVFAMRELDAAILVPAANHTAIFRVYNAIHFGRDDFVAALALQIVFVLVLPGLLWSLFARRRMEVLP